MTMNINAARTLGGQAANATKDTMPWHIWYHEVTLAAIQAGADAAIVGEEDLQQRWNLQYRTGEPVWMAAHSLHTFAVGRAKGRRADREVEFMHRWGR